MKKGTQGETKEKVKRTNWKDKKKIKWSSILVITDISPRKSKDWVYVILYTDAEVTVCCSETQAQRMCLNEPYEMKGYLNYKKGGVYLVLDKAVLADGSKYAVV